MFGWGRPKRPKVVAFDIIGTVFPITPLRPAIVALGLPPSGLEAWFATGLRDAFALTAAGDFAPLPRVLDGALDQLLAEQGLPANPSGKAAVLDQMTRLKPRPDTRDAFEAIARAGMRIVAVSNGSRSATRSLLQGGQLDELVAHIVSVEDVKLFKPRREIYDHAVRTARVKARRVALVAAHGWDINGAKAAGLTAAYLSADRPFPSVMRHPDVEADSLIDLARALIAL